MKISKKSWHYRIYRSEYGDYDDTSNLCSYVQGILWVCLCRIIATLAVAIFCVVWVAAMPFIYAIMLCFGVYPTSVFPKENGFRSYKPVYAFGHRIYPAHILAPALSLWALVNWWVHVVHLNFDREPVFLSAASVVILLALAIFFNVLCREFLNSVLRDHPKGDKPKGAIELLYEYAKAKKSRFCPVVTFVDE